MSHPPAASPDPELHRMQGLIADLDAIVWEIDTASMAYTFVTEGVRRLLGYAPEEWLAEPGSWVDRLHPEDRPGALGGFVRTAAEGGRFDLEYRILARDGRWVWVRDLGHAVTDDGGAPVLLRGLMVENSSRRALQEKAVLDAEERYRALIEQSPAIVYIDPVEEGPTIYMSPQVEAVLGYAPEEWYADPDLWSTVVHPDDRGTLRVVATDDARTSSTYRMIAKDGRTVWVTDRSTLLVDDDGTPRYWQGVLVDVTEQHRREELEADLEREHLEAERLRAEDEMKTTFLQAVSHDLRTPLAAILGLAVTLEREELELSPEEERDMARRIATNARKLDRIVGDFLDLERLNRGVAQPELQPVDVGALVREIVGTTDLVGGRPLELDVGSFVLSADAAMIERIVENLLVNAARHTPADARIWVRIERTDGGALLVVEDDGPGVAPEDREAIFEPFRQARGTGGGSGVGLALVSRFAKLHGGRAWVEERTGGGASFRVLLAWEPPGDQATATGSSADNQA